MAKSSSAAALGAVYERYAQLKDWTNPFTYSADQAEAWAGELGTTNLAGKEVLEIGFGEGGFLAWAMDHGATVAGTEINAECIRAAEAHGLELLPSALSEVQHTQKGRFDFIVAFDVFEHLQVDQIVENLNHCSALLKPGGQLILRFPNAQSPFGQAPQYSDITHLTALSGERLRQLAAGTDLTLMAVRGNHRVYGQGIARKIIRTVRYSLQSLLEVLLRFIYVMDFPLAPVVTSVLEKRHP